MRQARHGFTLIELMIVVTVMGSLAAMIAPGIGEFMADARASGATEDLVRLSRHMRSRAEESGLAHLLVFGGTSNDSGGLGLIQVYEGMNNHCRQTPWMQAINGSVTDGHAPVDGLNLGAPQYNVGIGSSAPTIDDRDRQVISLRVTNAVAAPDAAIICYEPSGAVWEGAPSDVAGAGFVFTKPNLPIIFTISRKVNSVVRGRERTVTFPTAGIARFHY